MIQDSSGSRKRRGNSDPKTETSYQRVTNLLRTEILAGDIPLGGRLIMTAIAERFGVSVQPVREALQQLEGEGLVEMIPNHGARVRQLDRNRLVHSSEIGEALECFLARQFADGGQQVARLLVRHDRAARPQEPRPGK